MRNLKFDVEAIREAIVKAILFTYIDLNEGSFKCNQVINVYASRKATEDEPSTSGGTRKKTLPEPTSGGQPGGSQAHHKKSKTSQSRASKLKMRSKSKTSTSKQGSNRSKRFKEESHLQFLQELQSNQTQDPTVRKRMYLQQNEGKRDKDIMGIALPSSSTIGTHGSRTEHKERRSTKRVAYENNFVMTSYPNLLTLMKEKLHCGGDNLLNEKQLLNQMCKRKHNILHNIFKRKVAIDGSSEKFRIADNNEKDEMSLRHAKTYFCDKLHHDNPTQETIEIIKNCIETIRIQECEVKKAIRHFVKDPSVFTKLQNTINSYIHFQIESERKAWKVASELYDKQQEMKEKQCEHLKILVDSLIRENTRVHNEFDTLEQQNEFLLINLKIKQTNKRPTIDINDLILNLYQNNEDLRRRLRADICHIDYLQKELKCLHDKNNNLNDSNMALQIEISTQELIMQRYKDQNMLDADFLRTELEMKNVLINECEKHKRELLQMMNKVLTGEKDPSLSDTLNQCKHFILSQSQEVTNTKKESNLLKSDIQNLRTVIENHSSSYTKNLNYIREKVKTILIDYETFQQRTNDERVAIRCRMKAYKDEINTITKLNETKTNELHNLKIVSEKLENDLRAAYERNQFMQTEIEQTNMKHQSIIQYQDDCYKYLLKLHEYLIEMKQINSSLQDSLNRANESNIELRKGEFDHELTNTNNEKHLIKELEQTVNELQVELTKLSIMQEYYKQLQEQHKEIVHNRDKSICELNEQLAEMKQQHLFHSNEKIMLCRQVEYLDQEVKKLTQELNDTQNLARETADENRNAQIIIGELGEKYRLIEKERDALLTAYQELKAKETSLHEKLNKKCEENMYIIQQVQAFEETVENLKRDAINLKDESSAKSNAIQAQMEVEKQALQNTIEYLQCVSKKEHAQLMIVNKTCQDYETQLNYQKQLIQTMETQIEALHKNFASTVVKNEALETENNQILESQQKVEEEFNLLQKCINDTSVRNQTLVNKLKGTIFEKDESIKEYKQIICNLENAVQYLRSEINSSNIDLEVYKMRKNTVVVNCKNTGTNTSKCCDIISDPLNISPSECQHIKADHKQLAEELLQAVDRFVEERNSKKDILKKYIQLKMKYGLCLENFDVLETEMRCVVDEVNKLNNQQLSQIADCLDVDEKTTKITELEYLNETLTLQIERLKKNLDENHQRIIILQNQIGDLENEIAKVKFENEGLKLKLLHYSTADKL